MPVSPGKSGLFYHSSLSYLQQNASITSLNTTAYLCGRNPGLAQSLAAKNLMFLVRRLSATNFDIANTDYI